jgi:hypothetical protein
LAQASGFKVRYLAGGVETKTDRDDWRNNLVILSDEIRVELRDGQRLSVDPKSVTSISYGREATRHVARWVALGILVHPIAAVGLLNENVKHYVSIEYETAEGKECRVTDPSPQEQLSKCAGDAAWSDWQGNRKGNEE